MPGLVLGFGIHWRRTETGGGTPTPSPAPPAPVPSAPVLSDLTEGWSSGDNPPGWQSTYANVVPYDEETGAGDRVRATWRLGDGDWTTEDWIPLDAEAPIGGDIAWPVLDATDISAGGSFEVYEETGRDIGLATEAISDPSNTWSDTLDAATVTASIVATHRQTAILDYGYGSSPAPIPESFVIDDGDKVVLQVYCKFNGDNAVTGITANGGSIQFTESASYASATDANAKIHSYYADTADVTEITDILIEVTGSTHRVHYACFTVAQAPAGGPLGHYEEIRFVTNEATHDVDGGLVAPEGGALLLSVSTNGADSYDWTGAEEQAEVKNGGSISAAIQREAGEVYIGGQPVGGPAYGAVYICNTVWGRE